MAAKVISIEIGYSLTRICEIDYKAKAHKVYKSISIPTPQGVLSDGTLMITPDFVEMVKSAITRGRIKSKQVVFTITSAKIASREVTIPFVKENRIADVVAANASDYFPVDLSQYQLAHTVLGVMNDGKGNQQYKLNVLAAPAALLTGYYDLAKALKLELVDIDYAANSIFQLVKHDDQEGQHLVIKVDEISTLIMVVDNGNLVFSRNVAYGLDDAYQVIEESLKWGAMDDAYMTAKTAGKNETLSHEPVAQALAPLATGIGRVVDFYLNHNADVHFDTIKLTGLGADFMGLDKFLSEQLSLNIEILSDITGLSLERNTQDGGYGRYFTCAGAGVDPVGLVKKVEKKKSDNGKAEGGAAAGMTINPILVGSIVGAIGLIAAVVIFLIPFIQYNKVQEQNRSLNREIERLSPVIEVYNKYVHAENKYNRAVAMYSATQNRNEELYEFIAELEQKMPSGALLESFESDSESVTLNVIAPDKDSAAAFMEQLRTFKSLLAVEVSTSALVDEIDEESGVETVKLTITASYKPMDWVDEEETEEVVEE